MKKIELDAVVADRITVLNLKEYRSYLKKELKDWRKNPKSDSNPSGYWLHPDDVAGNIKLIDALNLIIKYFGEE
jgi:ABC-type amino acid transport substrate-binding protein